MDLYTCHVIICRFQHGLFSSHPELAFDYSVACYCIPIKPQSPDQGATDECYGTECYYYDTDYPTETTVNVNFPENLTDAVLSFLPVIEASQRETVDLLNGTLVFQESILASQNNAVALQNKTLALQERDSVSQDEALVLQNKSLALQEKDSMVQDEALVLHNETLTLLKKNTQHVENIEASLDKIANMTSTMNAVTGNVVNLLQKHLNVLRIGLPPPRDFKILLQEKLTAVVPMSSLHQMAWGHLRSTVSYILIREAGQCFKEGLMTRLISLATGMTISVGLAMQVENTGWG